MQLQHDTFHAWSEVLQDMNEILANDQSWIKNSVVVFFFFFNSDSEYNPELKYKTSLS